jgi:hypothetical protein
MSAHRSERQFVWGFRCNLWLAPPSEEHGGDGWGQASYPRTALRLAPFSAAVPWALRGKPRPDAAQQASGRIVGTVNAANVWELPRLLVSFSAHAAKALGALDISQSHRGP